MYKQKYLSKFKYKTNKGGGGNYINIIELVDSISRDEPDSPLTQYITNGGISRTRHTITHFKHHHRALRLISNRMKSTKVQTLGGIWRKYWIENILHAYVLGIYRTSFQHNLHCFINACVHVVNDYIVSNKPV